MNDVLYKMYFETMNLIKRAEMQNSFGHDERILVEKWRQTVEIIDEAEPNYKSRYERQVKNQTSFTPEQIDFICYQIGYWYLEWKDRIIIDLKGGTHRLGFAKEQLKSMICGDGDE